MAAASICGGAVILTGCIPAPSTGFSLPEGDIAAGQEAFVDLGCNSCHTVAGYDQLREGVESPEKTIPLGGAQTRIFTYGELVTSVINPSHKISQRFRDNVETADGVSLMRNYNDVMTITELTDIVTFLEQTYTLKHYERTPYYPYPY